MLATQSERLKALAAEWDRRRQGNDSHAVKLKRRRIYILPTRFGIVFAAVVFAMLLASLNYNANLGFALTFLLAGLGLVIMHTCHNNLLALTVRFAGADPVFAGDDAKFRLAIDNTADVQRFDIVTKCGPSVDGPADIDAASATPLCLHVASSDRGYLNLPRFSVSTRYPGNLFRAWTWIRMDARCLVYPDPAPPGRPLPSGSGEHGSRAALTQQEDDFVGLREAQAGDPPRRIAWKAFARNDQLLAKEFAGGIDRPSVLSFDALPDLDTEAKLAQLTRWCLDAAEAHRSFSLVLPEHSVPLGSGDRHLHDCLQALALYGKSV